MKITEDSYDLSLNIAFNMLIVALFIVFNPLYALFFSSLINIFCKKINFKLFSFVFALSFALIFTNRDPGSGGDVLYYIERFSDNIGYFEGLKTGEYIEPLWVMYGNIQFFVFQMILI